MSYKHFLVVMVCFLITGFISCDKGEINNNIYIQNTLKDTVYVVPAYHFPDTLLNTALLDKIKNNPKAYFISANSSGRMTEAPLCDEAIWKRQVPQDVLQLFVITYDVYHYFPYQQIIHDKMYVRRIALTYEELVDNGFSVIIE